MLSSFGGHPRVGSATPGVDEAWRGSLGLASALLVVTPAEAAQLRAHWRALVQPYLDRKPEDHLGARHIRYFLAATPLEGTAK